MRNQFQKIFASSLVLGLTTLSQSVFAETVVKAKKWALEDYTTAAQPRNECIAWTYASKGSTIYRLELHRIKNEKTVTEVQFRQTGAGENSSAWQISIEDNDQVLALGLRSQDADSKYFWPVPRTEVLVNSLAAGKDLKVVSKGGAKEVKFDLAGDGFAQVWSVMQSRCSGDQQINNADFEREFMAKSLRPVDPLLLTTDTVTKLKATYLQGYQLFLQKLAKAQDLNNLREQFKGQLDEYERLQALVNQITNSDLPALLKAQTDNETLKSNSDAELSSVNSRLPELQNQVNRAQEVLTSAQNSIAPYLADHANLANAVYSARSALQGAQSRLTQIQYNISRVNSELQSLDMELQRLDRDISDARSRLVWAQQEYSQADREYRQFNPQREERERLQSNYQYQNAKNQLQSAQSQLSGAQAEQSRASADLNRAQQALRQCQATAGANCSAQQNQVNAASNALQRANSAVQRLQSQIRQSQNTINSIESQVRSDVRQMENRLRDRADRARRQVDDLNNIIIRSDSRERDIRMYEIPNRRNQLDSLQRDAASTQSEISSNQARVSQAERDLDSFEVSVGWNAKKSSLDSAQSDYDGKTAVLGAAQARKSALESTISNCLSERARIAAAVADKNDLLSRSNARMSELKTELEPYEQQKAKLDLDAQAIQASLNVLIDRFDSALPH
jgi:chromosome segregation ATPase